MPHLTPAPNTNEGRSETNRDRRIVVAEPPDNDCTESPLARPPVVDLQQGNRRSSSGRNSQLFWDTPLRSSCCARTGTCGTVRAAAAACFWRRPGFNGQTTLRWNQRSRRRRGESESESVGRRTQETVDGQAYPSPAAAAPRVASSASDSTRFKFATSNGSSVRVSASHWLRGVAKKSPP